MLDTEFHIVSVYSQEEIRAIAASEKIAKLLKIMPGSPVLERKQWCWMSAESQLNMISVITAATVLLIALK